MLRKMEPFEKYDNKRIVEMIHYIWKMEAFIEEIRDNFDCDEDAHKYNTTCRACKAKKVLEEE